MWTNLTGVVGAAIQKVREIESQLDNAVGVEKAVVDGGDHFSLANPDNQTKETPQLTAEQLSEGDSTPTPAPPKRVPKKVKEESNNVEVVSSPSVLPSTAETNDKDKDQKPALVTTRKKKQSISPISSTPSPTNENTINNEETNSLRFQIKELADKLAKSEEKHKEALSEAHRQHQIELASLKEDHGAKLHRWEQEQFQLKEQLQQCQQEKIVNIASIESLQSQLSAALAATVTPVVSGSPREESTTAGVNKGDIEEELRRLQQRLEAQCETQRHTLETSQQRLQRLQQLETQCDSHQQQLQLAKEALAKREESLEQLQNQLVAAVTDTQRLQCLNEELTAQNQLLQSQVEELQDSVTSLTNSNNNSSNNNATLQQLQEQLAAYQSEGQKLAKKQSEMEKSVRQSKQQLREKETEFTKLKESKEQLVKVLEQTQDALRKQEAETEKSQKALQAMQAVSQASSDRLSRLELDLQTAHEEQNATRKALEHSWAELAEAKRLWQEQKLEGDELRRQLGEGASRVMSTESLRREVEQREAVLRATSQQLTEQLQRSMAEASAREERLRDELQELRRRWQEAVLSREALASELAAASGPLLRQIASLQEQLRQKTEQWTQVETALIDRAMKSETLADQSENRRTLQEEQLLSLRHTLTQTQARLAETQQQLHEAQDATQKLQRIELRHSEDRTEWQSRLQHETAALQALHTSVREMELRHRLALAEMQETLRETEKRLATLATQCEELTRENVSLKESLSLSQHNRFSVHHHNINALNSNNSVSLSEADVADGHTHTDNSFVAVERQQQRQQKRQEEILSLQQSVQSLQQARDALLEEVSFLSARNAQLEDETLSLPTLQETTKQLQQQVDVLLVLLGEKEEENETLTEDLRDTKTLYRDQLDTLLNRCLTLEQQLQRDNKEELSERHDTPATHPGTHMSPPTLVGAISAPSLSALNHSKSNNRFSPQNKASLSNKANAMHSDSNLVDLAPSTPNK